MGCENSPPGPSGATTRASTGTSSSGTRTRGCSASSPTSTPSTSSEPALHQVDFDWNGFEWLDLHDWENSVLAFLRRGKAPGETIVVACNFTPVAREGYRVGVPDGGYYRELLNTDSHLYAGSNFGNGGGAWAEHGEHGGRPFHVSLRLPPLGVVLLKAGPGPG